MQFNDEVKEIKLGNTKYGNKEFNISMVEIKEDEEYNFNFLELDDDLYRDDVELYYYKESINIINYDKNNSVFVSYGLINNLNKSELIISGNINSNLNGYPIFNVTNNKIIGIFNSNNKYFNKGIFFNYLINEFINIPYNEISIKITVKEEDLNLNNKIYFLDNYINDDENIIELEEKENSLELEVDNSNELEEDKTEKLHDNYQDNILIYFPSILKM